MRSPDLQAVYVRGSSAGLLGLLFGHEQLGSHVLDRDVVLRIGRFLPHVASPCRVHDGLTRQDRAHPSRHGLDVVDGNDVRGVVGQGCQFPPPKSPPPPPPKSPPPPPPKSPLAPPPASLPPAQLPCWSPSRASPSPCSLPSS